MSLRRFWCCAAEILETAWLILYRWSYVFIYHRGQFELRFLLDLVIKYFIHLLNFNFFFRGVSFKLVATMTIQTSLETIFYSVVGHSKSTWRVVYVGCVDVLMVTRSFPSRHLHRGTRPSPLWPWCMSLFNYLLAVGRPRSDSAGHDALRIYCGHVKLLHSNHFRALTESVLVAASATWGGYGQ